MKNDNHYLHDKECGLCVLGALLVERNATHQVRELLIPNSFHFDFHREVYCTVLAVTDRGDRADIVSIMPELRKRKVESQPYDIVSTIQNHTFDLIQHAYRLNELEERRSLCNIGQYLVANGANKTEDIEDVIQSVNDKLASILGSLENHARTAFDYMIEANQRVDDNLNSVNILSTLTGFHEIDEKGGFQLSNLIICATESGQGKTALANVITLSATKGGANIAFYSMETSGSQLMARLTAIEPGIPISVLISEKLTDEQIKNSDKTVFMLSKLGIYLDDHSTFNTETILFSTRSVVVKYHIEGVVIDHLQILIINKKSSNVEEAIAKAARRLKNIAKEPNIWIPVLSQLSRDNSNPTPSVNRLRGSGQTNEAADITILPYCPEVYDKRYSGPFQSTNPNGTVLIDIAKGRNIGVSEFIAGSNAAIIHFHELNERPILPLIENKDDSPF